MVNKYLLLAEFSVRTVNYGPSFFPSINGPRASRGPENRLSHIIKILLYGWVCFRHAIGQFVVRNLLYGPKFLKKMPISEL